MIHKIKILHDNGNCLSIRQTGKQANRQTGKQAKKLVFPVIRLVNISEGMKQPSAAALTSRKDSKSLINTKNILSAFLTDTQI
ncbi:hypothetical protein OOT00_03715 [Desulfobotulus sp. H1]|uniref:Uncharacterized protein n=1 Tax=Desulfobotulus pelophilus TaxID=2823377 RepID=A0ABT3N7E6_9BACT|nr:hypothetical protein [Desulfobotulus pelophilus]MCW7753091.1 hypothetical protein [Desulfobotulus pelophilus]